MAGVCVQTDSVVDGEDSYRVTISGVDGSYRIDQVPAGFTRVETDAHCAGKSGQYYLQQDRDVTSIANSTTTVDIALPIGGSISGTVLGPNGFALGSDCVQATQVGSFSNSYATPSMDDGSYTVTGLLPGEYNVDFYNCGEIDNLRGVFYDNTVSLSGRSTVTVVKGNTTDLPTQHFSEGGEVDIDLSYASGIAASQVMPFLVPVGFDEDDQYYYDSSPASFTDGVRRLFAVRPGTYNIAYSICPNAFSCLPATYYPSSATAETAQQVTVVAGQIVTVADIAGGGVAPTAVPTTTDLAVSPNPVEQFGSVTLTARVHTSTGQPVNTGEVTFRNGWGWVVGTESITNGVATATMNLAVAQTLRADYAGGSSLARSAAQAVVRIGAPNTGSGGGGGAGSGGGGGGGAPVGVTGPQSGTVKAGGTFSSDPSGTSPGKDDPLVASVTSPVAGSVSIDKTAPDTKVSHYDVLGIGATITAPTASVSNPLVLTFKVADAALPGGVVPSALTVFRNGAAASGCTSATGATPDPCVVSATTNAGVTTIVVRSSHASTWDVEAAHVARAAGADRFATAVAVSQDSFPNGNAGAVVLADADGYADALVGGPLAAAKDAPLLLTHGAQLPDATATEIKRVLPSGGTVYVLGGTKAIPDSVKSELTGWGYSVVRYSGSDRYGTAVAVAGGLGNPKTVLLASGTNFPDALSAGPAAAHVHGVVLLTNGKSLPSATSTYLSNATTVYAIGGPAAAADSKATAIVGADRYTTAVDVATTFFTAPTTVGIATGEQFPDALSGGAQLGHLDAPLLLSDPTGLPPATLSYLSTHRSTITATHLFGGTNVLQASVVSNAQQQLDKP